MPHERRLAAPVLADDRHGLARLECQVHVGQRPRAVRVDEPHVLDADCGHDEDSRIVAGRTQRVREADAATADRPRGPSSAGSSRTDAAGPFDDDSSIVEDDDARAEPVEQVGLVLGDQQRSAGRRELAQRLADEARPLRVELGRRLVEDEVRRTHRQQGGDARRAGPGHPIAVAARVRRGPRCRAWRGRSSPARPSRAAGSPRFIGPSATSSKTEPGDARQLRGRVLEPDPDPGRELVQGLAVHRLAIDREAAASERPADRAGCQAAMRRDTGSTCRPRSRRPAPTISPSARVRSMSCRTGVA